MNWRLDRDELRTLGRSELAHALGLDPIAFETLAATAGSRYRLIALAKKSGGSRLVAIPEPELKLAQRRLQDLLAGSLLVPKVVHGGIRGRSFVDHAACHRGRSFVLTMDLRDFFGHVRPEHLAGPLRELGLLPETIAAILALAFREGSLPQGAPSSPLLANLALEGLDRRILRLARRRGLTFSRYLDDFAFSGKAGFRELIGPITVLIREAGFEPAPEKTAYMGRHERQVVTGLVVNDRLRPTPAFYEELEQDLRLHRRARPRRAESPGAGRSARIEGRLRHLARFDRPSADRLRRRYEDDFAASRSS